MSKTQAQRIEDAVAALKRERISVPEGTVTLILEAADRPRPNWPSPAVVDKLADEFALRGRNMEIQCALRGALLEDPIIQAAIAYERSGRDDDIQAIVDAVNEAGL